MKKTFLLTLFLTITGLVSHAGDGTELRKCINGYHIIKRYSSASLKTNECKLVISYFDGQMNKITTHTGITHNTKITRFPSNKTETHSLKLPAGKYKLVFHAQTFIPITSDTLEFAKKEIIEIRVNLDSKDQPVECDKPVIYVYPTEEMPVYVTLNLSGDLGFTYPTYKEGWSFTATPEGIIKMNGQEYNYLFWEGSTHIEKTKSLDEGFEVFKDSLVPFFEKNLTAMGLNSKEQQDFITYWVPRMSKYNAVQMRFVFNETFNLFAPLNITPRPDNIFRVFMIWAPMVELRKTILVPQEIPALKREGFTVVEWGGTEIQPSEFNNPY